MLTKMRFETMLLASGAVFVGIVALWLTGAIDGETLKAWIEAIYGDVTESGDAS